MASILGTFTNGVRIFSLILLACVFVMASSMQAGAQSMRVLCLDEPELSVYDTDGDNAINVEELDVAVERNPSNEYLRSLKDRVDEDGFTEVQYTGTCHAEGEPGESAVGEPGESAVGEPGESVQGQDGASVSGQDGQDASVTVQENEEGADSREGSEGTIVCAPSPQLSFFDENDDGVLSIEEIDALLELVGGNAELEAVRDEAVDAGLAGIRYRDCEPGTPAATPTNATPVATLGATPDASPSPSASGIGEIESEALGTSRDDGKLTTLLYAGAGGTMLGAVLLIARGERKS